MRYLGHNTWEYVREVGDKMHGVTYFAGPPGGEDDYKKKEQKRWEDYEDFLRAEQRMQFAGAKQPRLEDPADKPTPKAGAKQPRPEDPADKPTPKKAKPNSQN